MEKLKLELEENGKSVNNENDVIDEMSSTNAEINELGKKLEKLKIIYMAFNEKQEI